MQLIAHHHHFKTDLIPSNDKVALCERYVIDTLLNSQLPDTQRENSIAWELKHHAGVTQMARLLARKRGLDVDLCTIGALLHDIYAIIYGTYKDHAHLGAPIASEIATRAGFGRTDVDVIKRIVYDHSDKHIRSDDPYAEFGKDADILDVFLYPGPFAEYLLIKPLTIFTHYLARASSVWRELGIPQDPRFGLLDNYGESWFEGIAGLAREEACQFLAAVFDIAAKPEDVANWPPAFCFLRAGSESFTFYGNRSSWEAYRRRLEMIPTKRASMRRFLRDVLHRTGADTQGVFVGKPQSGVRIEQAERLIAQIAGDESGLIVWPLAEVYELPQGPSLESRCRELGIVIN